MAENEIFEYSYCPSENREVKEIREKYLPREVTKLDQLRALDASATKWGTAVSLIHGIVCSLILGFGMSCCMVWAGTWYVPGILIGCIGLAGVMAAYPLYCRIVRQEREKIAPEILRLTEELMAEKCISF